MNKEQFLSAIQDKLSCLPQEDIDRSLDYYREMIEDRMEDGLSEEDAVAAMGSAEDIAAQILMDTPLPKLVKAKMKPSRTLRAWEIILLVLGSPVWLPLLLAAGILVLSLYIVLWSVIFSLFAADFCIGVGALCGMGMCFLLLARGAIPSALFLLSAGLLCAGFAILLFFLFALFARFALSLSKLPFRALKARVIRKEDTK